jgi:transcriptional regulator with XRE-family HTH domain
MEENQQIWVDIGHRLAQARKKRGMKQIEAAERLGLLQSNLSAIERGKTKFGVEVLLKACKLYYVNADLILKGKEMIETNAYLDELLVLAKRYDDILFKLDRLNQRDLFEIETHIDGLLMP